MNLGVTAALLLMSAFSLQAEPVPADSPGLPEAKPAVGADPADVLQAIPADAYAALIVRDLGSFDEKVAPLVAGGGLPVRPLAFLRAWLTIVAGLDDRGSAAVVLMPVEGERHMSRGLAILLPTTDQAALATLWNAQPVDRGKLKVTVAGRESFLDSRGSFSLLGPDLETVQAISAATDHMRSSLSSHAASRFLGSDVFLWINVSGVASGPLWEMYEPWGRRELALKRDPLENCRAVYMSGSLDREGLTVGLSVERTESGGDARILDTRESLLHGLPDRPFALAAGMVNDAAGTRVLSLGRIVVSALTFGRIIPVDRAPEILNMYSVLGPQIAGVSVSVSQPSPGSGGLVEFTKVIRTRSSAKVFLGELVSAVALLRSGLFVDPTVNAAMERLVYRPAAETCDDVAVDHLFFDPVDDKAKGGALLRELGGAEGLLLRMGAVDERHVVITLGGGLSHFKEAMASVRSGGAPLAAEPGIAASAGRLGADRSAEVYLAVDRLASIVRPLGSAMGISISFPETPELDAPVAATVRSPAPGVTQADVFVPMKVLKWPSAPPAEKPPSP